MKIPSEKEFYKFREVSDIVEVEPFVLRFWETEFDIRPSRTEGNHRTYTKDDLNYVIQIKRLLYDEGYTIAGAKRKLKKVEEDNEINESLIKEEKKYVEFLNEVKKGLFELKEILN